MTFAAACGDDDVDFNGVGGSGGRGGAAGAAGAPGNGGAAGNAGSPGNGGSGGSPGNGGTGGSSAGTGGSSAGTGGTGGSSAGTGGTGGSDIPDGGPDASTPPVDGGVNGDCPSFAEAAADISEPNGQNVVISRVVFENGGATVTFRGVGNGEFNFADPMKLCSGPEEADCIDVLELDQDPGDDALTVGEEETIFIDDVSSEEGELALITNFPTVPEAFLFAYVAWGDTFVSLPPSEGGDGGNVPTSLEDRAVIAEPEALWTELSRIDVGDPPVTINTILAAGDSTLGEDFVTCTGN